VNLKSNFIEIFVLIIFLLKFFLKSSVNKYKDLLTFGSRELLGIENETQPDGKIFEKVI
jgi:hypothetical protein